MMGMLIDQLCEATAEWSKRSGREVNSLTWHVMMVTGGFGHYDTVDKVDIATVPPEQRAKLTGRQEGGYYTLAQMKNWLERMNDQMMMAEDFIVVSIIREIERTYERESETYAKQIGMMRQVAEGLKGKMVDPSQRAAFIRKMDEASQQDGSPPDSFDESEMQNLITSFEHSSIPSLNDQKERQVALDSWRAVTAPILDLDNLEKARKEDLTRRFRLDQ